MKPRNLAIITLAMAMSAASAAESPRIVNLYNFIRNSDYRLNDSENVLLNATRSQIDLIKPTGLPATWALQYDALINPKYQELLKQIPPNHEIGAWWEIPRPLVEKAGVKWRGHNHEWDSAANIGFSPGYTPDERRRLVDIYMADFKKIYGKYPKSAGSWFIDEVTLDHMVKRYGIVASCNCKDQIGTDGYTLWGGYWNQAYYPSKLNAYMPAQTAAGGIAVPVFRMLGSDPIYQYGRVNGMFTLEPVYGNSGGSEPWARWFFRNMIEQPALAFAYTQAGQENSFGWDAMKTGLTMQVALLEKESKAGRIRVMTLAEAGAWFKSRHPLTPPTAVVCIDDWKNEGRGTVWYNSRFYRMNLLWEKGALLIRDIHRFDEKIVSVTHDKPLTANSLTYGTLPVMDGSLWSDKQRAAAVPVAIGPDNAASALVPDGPPVVRELKSTDLGITQPLAAGGTLHIALRETSAVFSCQSADGSPQRWAWDLTGGDAQKRALKEVTPSRVTYHGNNSDYEIRIDAGSGTFEQPADGSIRILADSKGRIILKLGGF
ncbi:MAG: hypothetical protein J0M04_10890 [Verrucomicrobia bacterium]|nr:hypothetical protein [Verrucomicrobiota bacterium]